MKHQRHTQQPVTQLSLFESHDLVSSPPEAIPLALEISVSTEPKEAYERRRVTEMAEKLCWQGITLEPVRSWPGVEIADGETAWRAFLAKATSGTIGLVLLALHALLDPCSSESIDEVRGLQRHPVEVISQVEARSRARMLALAKHLGWPRIAFWDADRTVVIGPGEAAWQHYFAYGCWGCVIGAVTALERRARGEPDKVERTSPQQSYNDDED
jgi:hypothetical protein